MSAMEPVRYLRVAVGPGLSDALRRFRPYVEADGDGWLWSDLSSAGYYPDAPPYQLYRIDQVRPDGTQVETSDMCLVANVDGEFVGDECRGHEYSDYTPRDTDALVSIDAPEGAIKRYFTLNITCTPNLGQALGELGIHEHCRFNEASGQRLIAALMEYEGATPATWREALGVAFGCLFA